MMGWWRALLLLCAALAPLCAALDNGLGLRPAMGFNTWVPRCCRRRRLNRSHPP